jgi:hypothetical protein
MDETKNLGIEIKYILLYVPFPFKISKQNNKMMYYSISLHPKPQIQM